ncbi:MAG TPA: homoserine dehydrogenase [Terriglobales bacterium]|nr:homoserine dehydrogenase [Terriglobales bacterium]
MATSVRYMSDAVSYPEESCKLALVGFGTVGSAVARLLHARRHEHGLQLTHVFNRSVERKKVEWMSPEVEWTENIDDVIASDADVVVELVGGIEPAYDWVSRALESGKSVVTANKQLIAHYGSELMELAQKCGQRLAFGASVAGGVPVLAGLQDGLGGDRLFRLSGILNGTCNYILTRIESAGISFAEALREAQEKGFAEADPTDDIDGYDARAKLVILARVGLQAAIRPQQVECESIRRLAHVDFEYAHELGCTIRQVSRVEKHSDRLYASVEPALVKQDSALAAISGSQNLVVSTGEFGGDTVFSGFGAGGNPTAVAVVSDLLQIARQRSQAASAMNAEEYEVSGDFESMQYVRFVVKDKPGIIATLARVFSEHRINVDAVLQRRGYSKAELPFVITLESCPKSRLQQALNEMSSLEFLVEEPVSMPLLA